MVVSLLSRVQFLVIPWAIAQQAHLSMRFSRQEHWSGLPFSFPGDLPNTGIEARSLVSPALAVGFFTISATWEAPKIQLVISNLIGRTNVEAETPILWLPDAKS